MSVEVVRNPLQDVSALVRPGIPLPFRVLDGQDDSQMDALIERGAWAEHDAVQAVRAAPAAAGAGRACCAGCSRCSCDGSSGGHWLEAVEQHHEQPDGGGYPHNVAGQGELTRLLRLGDVYMP